jgi:hypothetical protein
MFCLEQVQSLPSGVFTAISSLDEAGMGMVCMMTSLYYDKSK